MHLMSLAVVALVVTAEPQKANKMTPHTMTTVEFKGSKAWQANLPPEKQDLSGHFAQVKADFEKGELLGNGPLLESFHGFYVYDNPQTAAVRQRAASDYGVKKSVLEVVEVAPWTVLIDNSRLEPGERGLFVLNYEPGAAYERGKPIDQQAPALVKAHLDYIASKAASQVYLGGPVDPAAGRGRYIILAASKDAAVAFLKDDPAIVGQLFAVTDIKTWAPFQRQPTRSK